MAGATGLHSFSLRNRLIGVGTLVLVVALGMVGLALNAANHRGAVSALQAGVLPTGPQFADPVAPALRAPHPVRPAEFHQVGPAGVLRRKPPHDFDDVHGSLPCLSI